METRNTNVVAEEIISNANDIALDETVSTADARGTFCDAWPAAKKGLEMLRDLLKDPIAKWAITIAIGAGDAVSSRICK